MKKMLIAAAVSSVVLLSGCASGPDEATTAKLDELSNQISQVSKDVSSLRSTAATTAQVNEVKAAADRANQRIDNIAKSYKK